MKYILLIDDHQLFRQGMAALLQQSDQYEVTGMEGRLTDVMLKLKHKDYDLVLMDIQMPDLDGIEATREIKKHYPEVPVLALSMHDRGSFVKQMVQAGAIGYILKDADQVELLKAIEMAMDGKTYIHPQLITSLIQPEPNPTDVPLSARELEVIRLIADQLTTKEIAERLHLSTHTIETHRKNILLKLGLRNVAGLIKLASEKGWLE